MIIRGGRIHDGNGRIYESDILVKDGQIIKIAKDIKDEEETVVNATNKEIFPGFIQTLSFWGINGSASEIRPSSQDNDELSNPITPELDVRYAFNGHAATTQQLGAFGLTTIGVTPTDNNLFGGAMAVFEVDGNNAFKMCLKSYAGMKASVSEKVKNSYKAKAAPQTKMWIFQKLDEELRKASVYKIEDGKERDMKLEAVQKVVTGELPLFISCDNEQDIAHVKEIVEPYKDLKLVLCDGFGIKEDDTWINDGKTSLVVRSASATMDSTAMTLDLKAVAKLSEEGMPVALSGVDSGFQIREDVLWLGIAMMKVMHDEAKVLPMMTSTPAKLLGVFDKTGSIEEGKRADLVIWSDNPLETYSASIEATYMNGKVIYKKGDVMRCI